MDPPPKKNTDTSPEYFPLWEFKPFFRVEPSRGCGPYRLYDEVTDIVSITIDNWPNWIGDTINYLTSGLFLAIIITILW